MVTWRLGYRVGLDGLRGIAVLAVVFAHASSGAYPARRGLFEGLDSAGGAMGVQLFFVLSGFLITTLLLEEHRDSGSIDLRGFYARRARRLLPALTVTCVVFCVLAAIASRGRWTQIWGSALRAMLYVENVGELFDVPSTGALGHTWSLAVEEQFYLVWPVMMLVALRYVGRRGVAVVAGAAAVVTILAREVVDPETSYSLLRWDALAVGCLLALVPALRPPRVAVWAAAATFAAFVVHGASPYGQVAYLTMTAASAVLVLAALDSPALLRARPLVHVGEISYGLYLFHPLPLRAGWPPVLAVGAAIVAAELSLRFIERRFWRPRSHPAPLDPEPVPVPVAMPVLAPPTGFEPVPPP